MLSNIIRVGKYKVEDTEFRVCIQHPTLPGGRVRVVILPGWNNELEHYEGTIESFLRGDIKMSGYETAKELVLQYIDEHQLECGLSNF